LKNVDNKIIAITTSYLNTIETKYLHTLSMIRWNRKCSLLRETNEQKSWIVHQWIRSNSENTKEFTFTKKITDSRNFMGRKTMDLSGVAADKGLRYHNFEDYRYGEVDKGEGWEGREIPITGTGLCAYGNLALKKKKVKNQKNSNKSSGGPTKKYKSVKSQRSFETWSASVRH
jgi:hypothetical protein